MKFLFYESGLSLAQFFLPCDLQHSMTLLKYNQMNGGLQVISRDYESKWMTAVEIIDNERFLGAENELNLFVGTYIEGDLYSTKLTV